MNIDTWAVVLATGFGPILAVLITFWRDDRSSTYSRRLSAFRILMSTRRTGISPDHVGALNLVEVDFYGVKNVEISWANYKKHLNMDPTKDPNWIDSKEKLLADLLFQMSKTLRFDIPALDIFKGGYAPQGWQFREEKHDAALSFIHDLALGKKDLSIFIKNINI